MSIYASGEEIHARTYLGSHVYPTRDNPPAHVALAHIPADCVPGHDESGHDWPHNGQWLRLSLATVGPHGHPWADRPMIPDGGDVVLARAQALRLAAALLEWAATPEVRPRRSKR